jgi:hypothetical protein
MTDLSDFKLEIVAAKVNLFAEAPDNQCCGSGMFIPDPGSSFLSIPDPTQQQNLLSYIFW